MTQTDQAFFANYANRLHHILQETDWSHVTQLAHDMQRCWLAKKQLFLCGNGGSAGNAIHLANDYLYGIAKRHGAGMRVNALSANSAVLTCLGNDIGYDQIYAEQLAVQGQPGDLLIVLSGSGNSPNIISALQKAKEIGIKSYAILGFSGGHCKALADVAIHFPVDDMQIAEDLQLMVGHMLMQWLYINRPHLSVLDEKADEETVAYA
ncbi:MAG: SIS domain-containing protein [Gammaproteobacteria bacterium]|nr:SIS domain-containing protein [Gammaproteobacteria bacterium]